MMNEEYDILLNRFNKEAEVFMGASQDEAVRGGLLVFLPTAILCGVLAMLIFRLSLIVGLFGFAFGMLLGIGVYFLVFMQLKKYRKGKQIGFITQRLQRFCAIKGIAYSHIVHCSKTWMIGKLV